MAIYNGKRISISPTINITKRYYIEGKGTPGLEFVTDDDWKTAKCAGIGTAIDRDIIIPNEFNGATVTSIADSAFYDCDNIKSVVIPESIKILGKGAFAGCKGLEAIYFNATNMQDVFTEAERKYVTENLTYWHYPFYEVGTETKGTHLYIGENVERIPGMLFQFWTEVDSKISNLTAITFVGNSKCHTIGQRAFYSNFDISELILPDSVKTVEQHAFRKCRIQNLSLGSVEKLSAASFAGTHIYTVTLPATLTAIQHDVFKQCPYLEKVTFTSTPTMGQYTKGVLTDPYVFGDPIEGENSTSIKDIYMPWVKGTVEGAPWGATNANMHYADVTDWVNHTVEFE